MFIMLSRYIYVVKLYFELFEKKFELFSILEFCYVETPLESAAKWSSIHPHLRKDGDFSHDWLKFLYRNYRI